MDKNAFDKVAGYYDLALKLTLGKTIEKSQIQFLSETISSNHHVLVLGGGTGSILPPILKCQPSRILYLEASLKMMNIAKKKAGEDHRVEYRHGTHVDMDESENFDIVITPYVLDCFSKEELNTAFPLVSSKLKNNGLWLISDFTPESGFLNKLVVKCLYIVFTLLVGLRVHQLPNFESYFIKYGYDLVDRKYYLNKLIFSSIYKKVN